MTSLVAALAITLTALAQATQPCIVEQYNQKQQRTPLAGVQVEVRDAGSAISDKAGLLTLKFTTLKPGDKVTTRRISKTGFEIFNKEAIDQWNVSSNQQRFKIVLVRSDYFAQFKSKLNQSSTDNYKKKYEEAKAELAKSQRAGKLKEEEYRKKLNELEDQYDNALKNLDNYIDQFARIDLSEVSAEEQRILDMVQEGQIDEAVKAYEALDISGKLRQARETVKALDEGIEKLEDKKAQELQTIKDLKEKQQREIATLKLAGGKENYDKVAQMLKENALADTTNINVVWDYAYFACSQKNFKEAERFYLICLNGSKDNLYQQASFQNNLGNLYSYLNDYTKAEEFYLKALGNQTQLFSQNPDAYRADLAGTLNNLGNLYNGLNDYAKAKEYYLKALENQTLLFSQNPDAYHANLAETQNNLGNLYKNLNNYAKAEEYYLMALENYTQLFSQNPDTYRAYLASTQNNLGSLYHNLHDYAKAEEFYLKALENKTQLFSQNPDAYRADLAITQYNLGLFYAILENYTKAEEYFLKALENYTQLFSQNPDAYRADLARTQNNLGILYHNLHDYAKTEEFYLNALENYTQMFSQNPDAYRAKIARTLNTLAYLYTNQNKLDKAIETIDRAIALIPEEADYYDSKGEILLMKGDEQEAVKMWNKVLELDPDFLSKHDGETILHKQLKTKGLITE